MAREEEAGRKHPAWESWEPHLYSHTGLHVCMPSNLPKDHARAESSLKALQGLLGGPRGAWSYPCPHCSTQQEEPAGLCQAGRFPPRSLAQSSALMTPFRSRLCSWDSLLPASVTPVPAATANHNACRSLRNAWPCYT